MPPTRLFLASLAAAALLLPAASPARAAGHGRAPLSLALSPAQVMSGGTFSGTVTLSAPAPATGSAVLISAPAGVTVQGAAVQLGAVGGVKVTVAAGRTTATFHGFVAGVATQTVATIKATSVNDVATAALTIVPASVQSLSITPGSITGGKPGSGSVTLSGAAPAGTGATVLLSDVRQAASRGGASNNLQQIGLGQHNFQPAPGTPPLQQAPVGTVSVPTTVSIPPGASSATFPVTTTPVSAAGFVTVLAFLGTAARTDVVVLPPAPAALSLSPATIGAGASTTATLVLSGPAPAGGFTVPLSSSSTFATIPKLVTVPAGADRQSFTVGTPPPASASSGTALTLSAGATYPAGPVSATIAAALAATGGSLSAPTVPAVTDGTSNTVQLGGPPAATLTILPPPAPAAIGSFTLRPATVTGGQNTIAQLSLAGGITTTQSVTLTTDHPQLVQLPSSILIAPPHSAAIRVHTAPVTASTTVTITASTGTQQIPLTLTIVP